MSEIELGAVQERFADLVWANEPIASGELVRLCAGQGITVASVPGPSAKSCIGKSPRPTPCCASSAKRACCRMTAAL